MGLSGGLGLFWKDGVEVTIHSFSKRHIDARLNWDDGRSFWFTGFHGNPKTAQRYHS